MAHQGLTLAVLSRLTLTVCLCLSPACDNPIGPGEGLDRPKQTGDGWATSSPDQVGLDPAPLSELLDLIEATDNHLIHGILIVKNQRLVFEEYWPGTDLQPENLAPVERDFDRNTLHYVASVSKSLTSALVGIAVDQGLLESLDVSAMSFFPEHADLLGDGKSAVTVRHLLAFSSGFDWNEFEFGFDDPRDSHNQMFAASDPIRYLLGRSMASDPGSGFLYNSGDTNLLGEIVRRVSPSPDLVAFAREHLFDPLGVQSFAWTRFPQDPRVTFASGGASLRPRDMAKFGTLYLNRGTWEGRRILPQSWVAASKEVSTPFTGSYRTLYGYGFNWWLGRSLYRDRRVEYFRASGWGGQEVYVFPELQMVVVFTAGGFYDPRPLNVNDLLETYILPAVQG